MFSLPMATAILCTLLVGAVAALWGQIPWALSQRASTAEKTGQRCQLAFSLVIALVFPVLGYFYDDWGGKGMLFLGTLGVTLGLALLGQHQSLRAGVFAVLMLCLAIPSVTVPTLTMLPRALDLSPVLALNLGFVGIGLGALLTPALSKLLWKRFNFRNGLLLLALAGLLPALMVSLTADDIFYPPRPAPPSRAEPAKQAAKEVAQCEPSPAPVPALPPRDSHWWVLTALGFIMFPLQLLAGIWRRGFLEQHDIAHRFTAPGYWLAYLGTPVLAGWIIPDANAAWGLLVLAATHAIIMGNLAGDYGHRGGTIGFWLAGASFAPLLPTLLAIPFVYFSNAQEAAVLGALCGTMSLSYFLANGLLQHLSRLWSAPAMIRLALMLTLLFGALSLTLALMHSELYGNPTRIRRHAKPARVAAQNVERVKDWIAVNDTKRLSAQTS